MNIRQLATIAVISLQGCHPDAGEHVGTYRSGGNVDHYADSEFQYVPPLEDATLVRLKSADASFVIRYMNGWTLNYGRMELAQHGPTTVAYWLPVSTRTESAIQSSVVPAEIANEFWATIDDVSAVSMKNVGHPYKHIRCYIIDIESRGSHNTFVINSITDEGFAFTDAPDYARLITAIRSIASAVDAKLAESLPK